MKKNSMEVPHKKPFSRRKFVSAGLFFTLAILIITAVLIQFFESDEESLILHIWISSHVLAGIIFMVLSVLHLILNWQLMKAHIKDKEMTVNREAIYAFLLIIAVILIGLLLLYIFLH